MWKIFIILVVITMVGLYLAFFYWPNKKKYTRDPNESPNPDEGKDFRVRAYQLGLKK